MPCTSAAASGMLLCRICCSASCNPWRLTSASTTCAPLLWRARAVASPIPLAPPVITVTAPAKSISAILRLLSHKNQVVQLFYTTSIYLLEGYMSTKTLPRALDNVGYVILCESEACHARVPSRGKPYY